MNLDMWAKDAARELLGEEDAEKARWYDLLWFLVPICGILLFNEAIKSRREK